MQRHYFANKCLSGQGYGFSSGHVQMWELDCEESWTLKNWCFWTMVLEKTLESPLDCEEIQPVHPKGDQSWVFIGSTDAEAETPILWPPDAKNWLIGRDTDAGKDWRREEKGDGWMASWTHWTWVWVNSGSWWWTGRPGVLWSMGSQRVGHGWVNELNWSELNWTLKPPQITTLPSCIFFSFGMVLVTASCTMLQTSIHSSSGTLFTRSDPLNLFVTSAL